MLLQTHPAPWGSDKPSRLPPGLIRPCAIRKISPGSALLPSPTALSAGQADPSRAAQTGTKGILSGAPATDADLSWCPEVLTVPADGITSLRPGKKGGAKPAHPVLSGSIKLQDYLLHSGLPKMLKTRDTVGTKVWGFSHCRWVEPRWRPCKAIGPDTPRASFLSPSCPELLALYIRCIQCCILFSPQLGLSTFLHFSKNS